MGESILVTKVVTIFIQLFDKLLITVSAISVDLFGGEVWEVVAKYPKMANSNIGPNS